MDLGFADKNQNVGNLAAQAILQSTKVQEQAIENQLDEYDNLLNDEVRVMKRLNNLVWFYGYTQVKDDSIFGI